MSHTLTSHSTGLSGWYISNDKALLAPWPLCAKHFASTTQAQIWINTGRAALHACLQNLSPILPGPAVTDMSQLSLRRAVLNAFSCWNVVLEIALQLLSH